MKAFDKYFLPIQINEKLLFSSLVKHSYEGYSLIIEKEDEYSYIDNKLVLERGGRRIFRDSLPDESDIKKSYRQYLKKYIRRRLSVSESLVTDILIDNVDLSVNPENDDVDITIKYGDMWFRFDSDNYFAKYLITKYSKPRIIKDLVRNKEVIKDMESFLSIPLHDDIVKQILFTDSKYTYLSMLEFDYKDIHKAIQRNVECIKKYLQSNVEVLTSEFDTLLDLL